MPGPFCVALLLAMTACGSDGDANRASSERDGAAGTTTSALPAPEGAIGSVTGMPANPGPGTSRIEPIEPVAVGAADPQALDVPPEDVGATLAESVPDPLAPNPSSPVIAPAPPDVVMPAPPGPAPRPIGTEAATETTTIVVEPADTGG